MNTCVTTPPCSHYLHFCSSWLGLPLYNDLRQAAIILNISRHSCWAMARVSQSVRSHSDPRIHSPSVIPVQPRTAHVHAKPRTSAPWGNPLVECRCTKEDPLTCACIIRMYEFEKLFDHKNLPNSEAWIWDGLLQSKDSKIFHRNIYVSMYTDYRRAASLQQLETSLITKMDHNAN